MNTGEAPPGNIRARLLVWATVLCITPSGAAPGTSLPARPASQTTAVYEQRIERLEAQHGPYDERLSEPLIGLGLLRRERGDLAGAAEVLQRAVHVVRVNHGLYDAGQIPILEELIATQAALGDWKAVNAQYERLYWVARRAYGDDPDRVLPAMAQLRDWHLAAVDRDTGEDRAGHLLRASALDRRAVEFAEGALGAADPRLAPYLYRAALTHFYLKVAAQRGDDLGFDVFGPLSPIKRRYRLEQARDEAILANYRKGRKLLERIARLYAEAADAAPVARALAPIYLADWELLFNHRNSALHGYRRIYEQLQAAGVPEDALARFFSRPVVLPVRRFTLDVDAATGSGAEGAVNENVETPCGTDDNDFTTFISWSRGLPGLRYPQGEITRIAPPATNEYARVAFTVRDNGWPEAVEVLETHPDRGSMRRRAQTAVWAIQFRPRRQGGSAVRTEDVRMCLVFAP